jgi:25S rRNA (uracil2634-N3)-methyltransferase
LFFISNFDFEESLAMKYTSAIKNLDELEGLGCTIVHNVDVHNMNQHLKHHTFFDRIIFNFPHSGLFQNEFDAWVIE